MKRNPLSGLLFALLTGLALTSLAYGQAANKQSSQQAMAGQKQKIKGVIIKRDPDSFILRDQSGAETSVNLVSTTKVEEKKGNPFRGAKNYAVTQLLRGLSVEVEGRRESAGMLVADKIKFSDNDLAIAQTVESRVTPVEGRVGEAENRLSQAEQNAQRLSGQLEELSAISNAARGGAQAAQETADQAQKSADQAIAGVNTTNERITNLVSALDDYAAKDVTAVNFKSGSAVLSREAKAALDELAEHAKAEKGYLIEVTGFASSEGGKNLNRILSQRRSEAVVRYLAENHMIPLRRMITPFGYGDIQPVADNSTSEGRKQNRRVEVKILMNRGLTTSGTAQSDQAAIK